jgi:hypothetical protein
MNQIADVGLELSRGQDTVLVVTLANPPAEGIADWTEFTCTLRECPDWPLSGADAAKAKRGDLDPSGWEESFSVTTATVADADAGVIEITIPRATLLTLSPGYNRYVIAAWRTDTGYYWQFVRPTWVSVLASVSDSGD